MSNLRDKSGLISKILVLSLLAISSASAYYVGDLLSWMGIAYYFACALAELRGYRKAHLMLWAAVGAHAALTGYSLHNWYIEGIEPCPYCFAAAGCILIAAAARTRLKAAVYPAVLVLAVGYSWPWLFASSVPAADYLPPVQKLQTRPAEAKTENIKSPVPAGKDRAETQPAQAAPVPPAAITPAESGQAPGEPIKITTPAAKDTPKAPTEPQTEMKPQESTDKSTNTDTPNSKTTDEKPKSG